MQEPAGVQGWIELFRSLGQALFEVLRAEAQALGDDFRRSGRQLLLALALLGAAAAIGFWTVGVVVLTLIAVLMIWLPAWAAALIVLALFVAVAGLLATLGVLRLRRLESPAESIRRRVADHLDWWEHRLLAEPAAPAIPPRPPIPPIPPIHPDDPLEEDEP
ncbi:MAG TPA: phage holin family protein [Thermoanaerobaculia bacterium]|jgi:hypothetical protein|nr:phage holin family protein [Thermoanaerobaculia bacterium]